MQFHKEVTELIFPRRCPVCAKIVSVRGENICPDCREELFYIKEPHCKKCGKGIDSYEKEYCYDCKKKTHYYTQGVGCFEYRGAIKDAIYQYKYKNKREYADFFIEELVKNQGNHIRRWNPDIIIPVPLHKKRRRKRGYNQAEIIAGGISKNLSIPMDTHILKRVKYTNPLKEYNEKERQQMLIGAFQLSERNLNWKKVLLIDDIYTTGSTIDAIAKELKEHNIEETYFLAMSIGNGY